MAGFLDNNSQRYGASVPTTRTPTMRQPVVSRWRSARNETVSFLIRPNGFRHDIGTAWYIMACVGLASALGMYLYGRWIRRSPTM